MVMVCVNLVSGTLVLREVQVDVQPKPYDPVFDSAERKLYFVKHITSSTIKDTVIILYSSNCMVVL